MMVSRHIFTKTIVRKDLLGDGDGITKSKYSRMKTKLKTTLITVLISESTFPGCENDTKVINDITIFVTKSFEISPNRHSYNLSGKFIPNMSYICCHYCTYLFFSPIYTTSVR